MINILSLGEVKKLRGLVKHIYTRIYDLFIELVDKPGARYHEDFLTKLSKVELLTEAVLSVNSLLHALMMTRHVR